MTTNGGAREALERSLTRIDAESERLNAFITLAPDAARAAADVADKAAAEGRWLGLLHGMPMAVKDCIDTAGLRTTSGSTFFEHHVPNDDAPVVARLRQAGAVLVGKATLQELCFGIRSVNPISGQCHNPWNIDRVPGGSSGGSGAALAADMVQGALGSDTGGSVRLPASFCGVSGLRPTVGRVPNHGAAQLSPTFDTIGPMARSVADVARILAVIAGPDRRDPMSVDKPLDNFLPRLDDGVRGLRIGVPSNSYFENVPDDIARPVMAALAALEAQGATLVDVELSGAAETYEHAALIVFSDACAHHAERLATRPEGFSADVHTRLITGQTFTGVDYAGAVRAREAWRRTLADVFEEVDILASPTGRADPPPIADDRGLLEATRDASRNTYAGGLGAIPGLSVPCGFSAIGLPVGLQLEGAWWQEPLLLQVGHAYQSATEWHLARPPEVA